MLRQPGLGFRDRGRVGRWARLESAYGGFQGTILPQSRVLASAYLLTATSRRVSTRTNQSCVVLSVNRTKVRMVRMLSFAVRANV